MACVCPGQSGLQETLSQGGKEQEAGSEENKHSQGKVQRVSYLVRNASTMTSWDALASKNTSPLLVVGGPGLPATLLSGKGGRKVTKASAAVTDDADSGTNSIFPCCCLPLNTQSHEENTRQMPMLVTVLTCYSEPQGCPTQRISKKGTAKS